VIISFSRRAPLLQVGSWTWRILTSNLDGRLHM